MTEILNREITITVDNQERKVFLQDGFYNHKTSSFAAKNNYLLIPHIHNYAEIHCYIGEKANFILDGKMLELEDSIAVIIPKNVYHTTPMPSDVSHFAFQIDMPVNEFATTHIPAELLQKIFSEISKQGVNGDHSMITNYLSFIASNFYEHPYISAKKTSDYAFIIQSFLSLRYNRNIHLSDIAKELHVSVKQAARLVLLHTGNTFSNELTRYRIIAAEQIMKMYPQFSIGEIANLVGYESHGGFSKAYKRYKEGKCDPK